MTPQQPEQPEDELEEILLAYSEELYDRWHSVTSSSKKLTREEALATIMRLLHRSNLEAQKAELVAAAPHFCDDPTNFVYYNERLAYLDKQLKEQT